jgi:FKBP-type peptidyl-prolyl cis-trans isomerase
MKKQAPALGGILVLLALATSITLGLSACENKNAAATGQPGDSTAATSSNAAVGSNARMATANASASSHDVDGIHIEDVREGNGKIAKNGNTVSVNYLGTLASNGQKFDSSYDRNEPITFKLGSGQVIEGWEKGIIGMKIGGKRTLTIPPDKAYGADGYPPVIPPNSTLKFDVELVDVK